MQRLGHVRPCLSGIALTAVQPGGVPRKALFLLSNGLSIATGLANVDREVEDGQ